MATEVGSKLELHISDPIAVAPLSFLRIEEKWSNLPLAHKMECSREFICQDH